MVFPKHENNKSVPKYFKNRNEF